MALDTFTLEELATDPDVTFECVQIAPHGGNVASVLFMVADPDYLSTISMVFTLKDFEAESAEMAWQTDDWLMSLVHGAPRGLSALEATRWVRDEAQGDWTRERVSDDDFNRLWDDGAGRQILVGRLGQSQIRTEGAWTALAPGRARELFDVHAGDGTPIYCCGARGTLQRLEGGGWVPVELHRQDWLRGLDVSPDKVVRLAGAAGTCLEVRDESEVVVLDAPKTEFFSVRGYRGEHYWGDEFGVYIQKGTVLEPFFETRFAFDLRTDGDYLYCVGTDTAWRFDGENWKTVTLTYTEARGFHLT